MYHSLKRIADEVTLGPRLLDKVKDDDEFKKFQEKHLGSGQRISSKLLCFGGTPLDEYNMANGSKIEKAYEVFKALSAATNELTFVIRNTWVTAEVCQNSAGAMGVRYIF
ncbi:MAG: hypothetical protein IT256_00245, partial [Chitinophagaceae bacterium]|nr:hypothetical protein [Chitinophagaceae bacterium]